ncbi:transcription factor ETV7-like [Argiope bruennichi]|uniref:Ets DNA-binding protein pokkuri like protein n=1 Tax=Argiope bruennichi TaxID=94029 RepID=A0A8T0EN63_ARGBR|nr:transcription factor ETV7-like [Argiope bruennichi]KAF8777240.1 Ets DNA-binding protein pokkuri like protein [Argiope bruennichi]
MLCPVECGALPSVAWPDRGLSSLSILPTPTKIWEKQRYSSIYKIIEDYSKQRHAQKINNSLLTSRGLDCNEPNLPSDPRQWSREDVARWIQYVSTTHQLPTVHLERFAMNGKALCLMSMDMFVSRVPLGGKLLYKDFQLKLSRALYS